MKSDKEVNYSGYFKISKKEKEMEKEGVVEYSAYLKKKRVFTIILTCLAIPLYIGIGLLMSKYILDDQNIVVLGFFFALVLPMWYGIYESVRLSKKIRRLQERTEIEQGEVYDS